MHVSALISILKHVRDVRVVGRHERADRWKGSGEWRMVAEWMDIDRAGSGGVRW
jgi:hypothetical protein